MNSKSTVYVLCGRQILLCIYCLYTVHGTHNHFIQKKILKIGPAVLFTHLKIILLQRFSVFSCIQTDPKSFCVYGKKKEIIKEIITIQGHVQPKFIQSLNPTERKRNYLKLKHVIEKNGKVIPKIKIPTQTKERDKSLRERLYRERDYT